MDKDTSQLQLYQHFLSFFMPEGILDFFEPVWMETQSLDSRESKKDILYSSSLHIYLDERDNRPDDLFTFLSNKEGYCKKGSIVAAVRGTKAKDVVEVLLKIPEEQRQKVKEVTMDLSESMADIVTQAFPNATIVLDCFHIMRRCNDAIKEMRTYTNAGQVERTDQGADGPALYKVSHSPSGSISSKYTTRSKSS